MTIVKKKLLKRSCKIQKIIKPKNTKNFLWDKKQFNQSNFKKLLKYYFNRFKARFKAKLVAQKFLQVSNINFCKTFILTMKKKLFKIYLTLYLALNLVIH